MPAERMKILAIDDHPDNLITLRAILADALPHAIVYTSRNGRSGIELALSEDPDVILLDIVMPGMDGFEVCRKLKADERLSHIPVIFLTAIRTDRNSRIRALEAGAEAFLGKPLDDVELLAQIRAMVKIRAANERQRMEREQLAALVAERTGELERELSERRKAEQELRKANEQLERDRIVKLNLLENLKAEIDARKKAREELEKNDRLNRILLDNMPCVTLLLKPHTREIVACNEAGAKVGAIPGTQCYATLWHRETPCPWCLAPRLWASGRDQHVQIDDGNVSWDIHWISISKDLYMHLAFDITERKRLEAQLRQAQKLEAIGTLAGGIAHDFNNILSPILGYTEMAFCDLPESNPMRADLEQVIIGAYRARDLVKQILAFSRYGQDQERVPIDIGSIIKEALKLLRASLPTTIKITKDIEKGTALADATQIHQIVVNLCTNASHAMENDGGTLAVSLVAVDLDGSDLMALSLPDLNQGPFLRLRVKDTGHGMGAETMGRIFDPYFTTKGVGKGSGLGLAVVHGIVKRHEGAILVHSEAGKGSTFDVYFPRIETGMEAPIETRSALPKGTERILLIDDEQMVLDLGTRILERLGYGVTSKTNGLHALDLFRSKPDAFDLIITDYTMPYLTGTDLAKEILRIRPDVPIILCTGFSERVTEGIAKNIGIKEFVMKPLEANQLAQLVRKTLDK